MYIYGADAAKRLASACVLARFVFFFCAICSVVVGTMSYVPFKLSLAGVLLAPRCFHHDMLRWCSLYAVNLGIAQLVAASAIIELLKVRCVDKIQPDLGYIS